MTLSFDWRQPDGHGTGERLFVGKNRIGSYIFDSKLPKNLGLSDKRKWRAYILLPGFQKALPEIWVGPDGSMM